MKIKSACFFPILFCKNQVATDIRLYLRAAIDDIDHLLRHMCHALIDLAEHHYSTILPGFTHMQVAQPVTFGHHLLAYAEMFYRDIERFSERPDAVPTWVARFNPSQMTSAQIDAVSGATPSNGTLRYTWDGTDEQGKPVLAGTYTVFLEGTLHWSTRVLYSAKVQWGNGNAGQAPVTVHKTGTSERNQNMIANVRFSHTTTKP